MSGELRRYLFKREVWNVGSLAGVFDGNAANIAIAVEVKQGVLIQILGFADLDGFELDVKRISALEILDFHGSNDPRCTQHTMNFIEWNYPAFLGAGAPRSKPSVLKSSSISGQ